METRAINTKHAGVIYWPEPGMTLDESVEALISRFRDLTPQQLGEELRKPNGCFSRIIKIIGPLLPDNVYSDILDAAIICAAISGALADKADE